MRYEDRLPEVDKLQARIAALRPLSQHELDELKRYYRLGLTYSSNALEGNSLTESETKVVLEDGLTVGGKPLRDHLEALGHGEAFDLLFELAGRAAIAERDILELHRLFYQRVNPAEAGRYRGRNVLITGTDYLPPPPAALPGAMRELVAELPALRLGHPVNYAAALHLRLVMIHPFVDGNGRTARLLMNLALLQSGYPVTLIPPVLRADYIAALRAADAGDTAPFLNFISGAVLESQREYLRLLAGLGV